MFGEAKNADFMREGLLTSRRDLIMELKDYFSAIIFNWGKPVFFYSSACSR